MSSIWSARLQLKEMEYKGIPGRGHITLDKNGGLRRKTRIEILKICEIVKLLVYLLFSSGHWRLPDLNTGSFRLILTIENRSV